jgi:hypothetical protein
MIMELPELKFCGRKPPNRRQICRELSRFTGAAVPPSIGLRAGPNGFAVESSVIRGTWGGLAWRVQGYYYGG